MELIIAISVDWMRWSADVPGCFFFVEEVKKLLGRLLVRLIHGATSVQTAQAHFEAIFSAGSAPEEIELFTMERPVDGEAWLAILLNIGFILSKREGRELITHGALRVLLESGQWHQINELNAPVPEGNEVVLKLGKRKFAKIIFN